MRLFLLLLLAVPTFAGTLEKLDLSEIDDDSIEIASPAWEASSPILAGRFETGDFNRTVARKLAGGIRNAIVSSQTLAPGIDVGEVLAGAMRSEGRKLGLTMIEPRAASEPRWTVEGKVHDFAVDILHMGYGALLCYAYLDVEVRVQKVGSAAGPSIERIRPARLFFLFNGGAGIADEAQLAMEKMILVGAQQILSRLNREHFKAPVLPAIEAKLAGLKKIEEQEGDLHLIGLSGHPSAAAALSAMLEKEQDENARTQIVYALANLGGEAHVPLLIRRYASEDADVRYATILALHSAETPEALAHIREKGTKDKSIAIRKLSERLSGR